jgi:lipopolysaccharide/colanic/teichoic acid biosynthesis glycosyltransferase
MTRLLDINLSLFALVLLSPLLFFIVPLLALTGENKIFYIQKRVGKDRRNFGLLKFATMLENSPNLPGGDITSGHDPRVLKVGKFLRMTKINEIPQLINILKGDLSFVGPRPLTPTNFSFYDQKSQSIITSVRPGLTGIGSLVFRDEEFYISNSTKAPLDFYREDISPYKAKLECWFSENRNITNYFILILLTFYYLFFAKSKLLWSVFKSLPNPPRFLL